MCCENKCPELKWALSAIWMIMLMVLAGFCFWFYWELKANNAYTKWHNECLEEIPQKYKTFYKWGGTKTYPKWK